MCQLSKIDVGWKEKNGDVNTSEFFNIYMIINQYFMTIYNNLDDIKYDKYLFISLLNPFNYNYFSKIFHYLKKNLN